MMQLPVVADPEADNDWLLYTLDVLAPLTGLAVRFSLVAPGELSGSGPALWYGVVPEDPGDEVILIPRRPEFRPGKMQQVEMACGSEDLDAILIYTDTIDPDAGSEEISFDLFYNVFAYVSCLEEYEQECRLGPLHSYALRTGGNTDRFDRPYATLLARGVAATITRKLTTPPSPVDAQPALHLTHDVDLIAKKGVTRLKEGVFRTANVVRSLFQARFGDAATGLRDAMRMIFGRADYLFIDEMAEMEKQYGFRSAYNLFSGVRPSGSAAARLRHYLFDPPYDPSTHPVLPGILQRRAVEGWEVGVHFAFDVWRDAERMRRELQAVERVLDCRHTVTTCRQHWLRFSLAETWRAHHAAGIEVDTTLGFNDRPGFRAGVVSPFRPYDHAAGRAHPLWVVPTILMDTHLFHYGNLTEQSAREAVIDRLLDEVVHCRGEAAVIWHTHVFSTDHQWQHEYRYILERMMALGMASRLPSGVILKERSDD
ncbi:MAG: hypothetical protein HQL50_00845 [Magnetococcales bacterium]|nr:hypothetical protein [Magnetococcales bacterium]